QVWVGIIKPATSGPTIMSSADAARVMRPYRELPFRAPDKIGMVIRHAAVVNRLLRAALEHFLHRHHTSIVAAQTVSRRKAPRFDPAFAPHVEGVPRRGADYLALHVHVPDRRGRAENLLNTFVLERAQGIVLVAGQHFVILGQRIPADEAAPRRH